MRTTRFGGLMVAAGMLMLAACSGTTDPGADPGADPVATTSPTEAMGSETGSDATSAPEGDPLRLVFLTNSSGVFSALSAGSVQGVDAKVDEINASGGILGRPVEIEMIDTESDPTRATAIAESIEPGDDLIGVFGPEGTSTCFAVRSVLIEKGILHYCSTGAPIPGGADGLIPGEFSPYYFAPASPPIVAGSVIPFAWMKEQGFTKVGLISSSDGSGQLYGGVLKATLPEGFELVADESFDATAPDVTPQMTAIRAAEPDVVYVGTTGAGLATVLQSSADLGMDMPFWAGWGNASTTIAGLVSGLLPPGGLYTYGEPIHIIADLPADNIQADALTDATALWQETYGEELNVDAAILWDLITNVAAGVEGAGTTNADDVISWLENDAPVLVGLAGVYDFTPDDHRGTQSSGLVITFTAEGTFALEGTIDAR